MTNYEKFMRETAPRDLVDVMAFEDCNICPARFVCTNDPDDVDYIETCQDTFAAWAHTIISDEEES